MAQPPQDNCAYPPIIELLSVNSTNNYALDLLRQNDGTTPIIPGTGVFAHEQWAGKGQRGKTWASAAGENIHLSVIVDPRNFKLENQFILTAVVALAVREFVETHTSSDIAIKWPNDIYFNNRKIVGMLIENIISGTEWKWAVIGIGINVNQTVFPNELRHAVSLKQITGKSFNCFSLAKQLQKMVTQTTCSWQNTPPAIENLIKNYNAHLYKKGEKVQFRKDSGYFEAEVKEVLPNGQIQLTNLYTESYGFGEVSWILE